MKTPMSVNVDIVEAITSLSMKDEMRFGAPVRTAGFLLHESQYDWEVVAEDLLNMGKALTDVSKGLPFIAISATITATLNKRVSIDAHVRQLDHEIREREATNLDSAWCGEQDHFLDVTNGVREERDRWVAKYTEQCDCATAYTGTPHVRADHEKVAS